MSGPKTGAISVEEMRRRELESLRARNASIVREALREFSEYERDALAPMASDAHRLAFKSAADSLKDDFTRKANRLAAEDFPSDIEEAQRFNSRLEQSLADLLEKAKGDLDHDLAVKAASLEAERQIADLARFEGMLQTSDSSSAHSLDELAKLVASLPAEASGASGVQGGDEDVRADAAAVARELCELILDAGLGAQRRANLLSLAGALGDALAAPDSEEGSVARLAAAANQARIILPEARRFAASMNELYASCLYESECCSQLGSLPIRLDPLSEYGTEEELEGVLEQLRAVHREAAEAAYIADSLDRVMAKHGYDVKRAVRLAGGVEGSRFLFMSSQDDSAIHSFIAPNGVVMMETAAADPSLQEGEGSVEVERVRASSSYDRMRLYDRQVSFCEVFDEFAEDLAEYGIVLDKRSDKEPSEENSVIFSSTASAAAAGQPASAARRRKRETGGLAEREAR